MAHTYVVTTAQYIPGSSPDPLVTIVGTVDTVPMTIQMALSQITAATPGGAAALRNLIAPFMLAAAVLASPATFSGSQTQPANLATGTFTQ